MVILLSAGEPSGLMITRALEYSLSETARVHHLASTRRLGPLFGFTGALKHSLKAASLLTQARREISALRPDRIVLVGLPGFHIPIGRWCRRLRMFTIQLGPPQFWAWGRARLKHLSQAANLVVCLFPFEESYLRKSGINCRYFGHPLLDLVKTTESREQTLLRLGFRQTDRYVVFMPGSRPAEQKFHIPLFERVHRQINEMLRQSTTQTTRRIEPLRGVLLFEPATASVQHGTLRTVTPNHDDLVWSSDLRYDTMTHADCAVICSGTATLEAAILGLPMVVTYHLPLADRLLARLLVQTRYFALPNIVAGRLVVPELLQPTAQLIATSLEPLLGLRPGAGQDKNKMREELARVKELIGPAGAIRSITRLLTSPTSSPDKD